MRFYIAQKNKWECCGTEGSSTPMATDLLRRNDGFKEVRKCRGPPASPVTDSINKILLGSFREKSNS